MDWFSRAARPNLRCRGTSSGTAEHLAVRVGRLLTEKDQNLRGILQGPRPFRLDERAGDSRDSQQAEQLPLLAGVTVGRLGGGALGAIARR
jgi:hypothetical protein